MRRLRPDSLCTLVDGVGPRSGVCNMDTALGWDRGWERFGSGVSPVVVGHGRVSCERFVETRAGT